MTASARLVAVADPVAAAAGLLGDALHRALGAGPGRVGLLLSGGRTPRAMLPLLLARDFDWARLEVAASDERLVPVDDPASTEGMIRAAFAAAGRPLVYRGFGPDWTADAALSAWRRQLEAMPWPPAAAFLGMGEDAHVASLFPGRPEAADPDLRVAAVPQTPPHPAARLTLGAAALRECPLIVMTVTGADKRAALDRALAAGRDPGLAPVLHVATLPQTTILVADAPSNPS